MSIVNNSVVLEAIQGGHISTDTVALISDILGGRITLGRLGCPGAHYVVQSGLELRDLSTSASQALDLKTSATTACLHFRFYLMDIR